MRRGKRLVLVGALFTVACTAVGIAYAAIPDANNVIHGCVSKGDGGGLRVVDTDRGQSCKTGELAVNWNQAGPKGLDGAPGKDGAAGPPGPPGSSTPARPAIGTLTATGQKQGPIPATGADPIVGMDWGVVSPTDPASGL